MKKIFLLLSIISFYIESFASIEVGCRADWNSVRMYKADSMGATLTLFVIVIIYFLVLYIKAKLTIKKKEEAANVRKSSSSNYGIQVENVERGCGFGFAVFCIVAVIAGLISIFMSITSPSRKENIENTKRKETTMVISIMSEDNPMKNHHYASKDEFKGKDTILYYEFLVYQNKTGKNLTEYTINYHTDGRKEVRIVKNIKPEQYFKTDALPFEKPPYSVDMSSSTVNYNNWKSRSRFNNKSSSNKKMTFLDYSDFVSKLNIY